MVSVEQAEQIVLRHAVDYGTEYVPLTDATGRVLSEDIKADRDFPPYNRVTMDGIAIRHAAFENGTLEFEIKGTQAAGDMPIDISQEHECIEIMTGAAMPETVDTVIRYEDVEIADGTAIIKTQKIKKGQSIHARGIDKRKGEIAAAANQIVDPAIISIAATVGKDKLRVKKNPRVVIVSTGDELVDIGDAPEAYQIRRSNSYTIKAAMQQYGIAADMLHIADDKEATKKELGKCAERYDAIILSGGISKGKYDYVPAALEEMGVSKLFHGVAQRPGKPFWFGRHQRGNIIFAFPGNPVSAFMCLQRYFVPWLFASQKVKDKGRTLASLGEDFSFEPALTYFLQVELKVNDLGHLIAMPAEGNGSGDFANLLSANAFMELPAEKSCFKKGEVYKVWNFKPVV